ncbi:MAG: amidohydrolase [Bacteroidales bacterium]|nr:amidohydrolase [Bacteroidales bacterium]
MKVKLFQQDILWGDPEGNRLRLDGVLARAGDADLFVFPEMFTTGFATAEGATVEENDTAVLDWMRSWAERKNAALAGSVALKTGAKCANRLFFVTPEGVAAWYDKRHLFYYGGEGTRFEPGEARVVVNYRGVRFLLLVCYDLRFPVWIRNRDDYDAILVVANWPDARALAWNTLLQARAIENQCYVLGCNRVGDDPACKYTGYTKIVNPYGEIISSVPDHTEAWAEAELDLGFLRAYSKNFPVLENADEFELKTTFRNTR